MQKTKPNTTKALHPSIHLPNRVIHEALRCSSSVPPTVTARRRMQLAYVDGWHQDARHPDPDKLPSRHQSSARGGADGAARVPAPAAPARGRKYIDVVRRYLSRWCSLLLCPILHSARCLDARGEQAGMASSSVYAASCTVRYCGAVYVRALIMRAHMIGHTSL